MSLYYFLSPLKLHYIILLRAKIVYRLICIYGLYNIGDAVNDFTFPPQLITKTMQVVPIIVMQMSRTTIGGTRKVIVDDDECSIHGCSRQTVAVFLFLYKLQLYIHVAYTYHTGRHRNRNSLCSSSLRRLVCPIGFKWRKTKTVLNF